MVLVIREIAKKNRHNTMDLITRPVGSRFYKKAVSLLDPVGEGEVVFLDFDGIKVIDSSFVDEFLVSMIILSRKRDFYLKLININEIIKNNIDSVFENYARFHEMPIAISTDSLYRNMNYYIGELSPEEKVIADFLRVNKKADIADIMKLSGRNKDDSELIAQRLQYLRIIRKEPDGRYGLV